MRFFLVIIIWVVIVGGLWGYISNRDTRRLQTAPAAIVDRSIEGQFAIEVTPTFSTEKDPFALTTTETTVPQLEIKLNGTMLSLPTQEILRGETIRLEKISGMLAGQNEIYVSASPPFSEATLEHGVRIRVFEDEVSIADETIWAGQGALVSGTISFTHLKEKGDGHDH